MKPATTLAAYAAALVLVFGAAVAVGNAVGPVGTAATEQTEQTEQHSPSHDEVTDGSDTDSTEQEGR